METLNKETLVENQIDTDQEMDDVVEQAKKLAKEIQNEIEQPTEESTETPQEEEKEADVDEVQEEESKEPEEAPVEEKKELSYNDAFEEPIVLKSKGLKIPVHNMEELVAMANKGLDYSKKVQTVAPFRKTIEFIQEKQISNEDLQLLADLKSGNKEAITSLAKQHKIDLYELDSEKEYVPNPDNQVPQYNEVEEVAQQIAEDGDLANRFKSLVQYTPEDFRVTLSRDASVLQGFANDVRNGVAEKVVPEAVKLQMMDNSLSFIDAYGIAYGKIRSAIQNNQNGSKQNTSRDSREKAAITSTKQSNQKSSGEIDIWEDGLSEDELMKRIQQQAERLRR